MDLQLLQLVVSFTNSIAHSWQSAIAFVSFYGGGINGDDETRDSGCDQITDTLGSQAPSVCNEHHFHAQLRCVLGDKPEFGMQHRFATRDHHVSNPLSK